MSWKRILNNLALSIGKMHEINYLINQIIEINDNTGIKDSNIGMVENEFGKNLFLENGAQTMT